MRQAFAEVWRVLRADGTLWVNIGDAYSQSGCGSTGNTITGRGRPDMRLFRSLRQDATPAKNLHCQPWRLGFALQADGWILRDDIIWHKPAPMPESTKDRPTRAHEYVLFLTKRGRYFYDAEAIKEPQSKSTGQHCGRHGRQVGTLKTAIAKMGETRANLAFRAATCAAILPDGKRNIRDVWTISQEHDHRTGKAHFAVFPCELPRRCILAGTSARGACPKCGAPWARTLQKQPATMNIRVRDNLKGIMACKSGVDGKYSATDEEMQTYGRETLGTSKTTGWQPTCDCGGQAPVPCTVLDPFAGTFTTCMVALQLGRRAIGIELNPSYVEVGRQRCQVTAGLPL